MKRALQQIPLLCPLCAVVSLLCCAFCPLSAENQRPQPAQSSADSTVAGFLYYGKWIEKTTGFALEVKRDGQCLLHGYRIGPGKWSVKANQLVLTVELPRSATSEYDETRSFIFTPRGGGARMDYVKSRVFRQDGKVVRSLERAGHGVLHKQFLKPVAGPAVVPGTSRVSDPIAMSTLGDDTELEMLVRQPASSRASVPVAMATAAPPPPPPFAVGFDLYSGRSNIEGLRRYSDGMWGGYGVFLPSIVYGQWDNQRGTSAKLAIGTGRLFNNGGDEYYQPAEAWYRTPVGSVYLTAGKFWVPYGLQEWQQESKPGLMLEWEKGPLNLAAATTYNRNTNRQNTYLRLGRSYGDNANVGLSLGTGRGLTYNSDHNRGIGLDATLAWHGWGLTGEYLEFRRNGAGRFYFLWGKLSYDKLGKWRPYVSRYTWNDVTDYQGNFRSTVLGLDYQVTPSFALESAYARVPDRGQWWLQAHWTWQRSFHRRSRSAFNPR